MNGARVIVRAVGEFVHEIGQLREPRQVRDEFQAHLRLQTGDDGGEVAVAGAFAVTVDRPLHLHRSGADGGQRVGHAQAAIVVRVDAERQSIKSLLGERVTSGGERNKNLLGHAPAVGVAEHEDFCPAFPCGAQGIQRVDGVGLVPVEEMFGVVDDLAAVAALRCSDGVRDHLDVFLQSDVQDLLDVQIPAFAEDGDHRRLRRRAVGRPADHFPPANLRGACCRRRRALRGGRCRSLAASKKAASFGLDPGQPPSM